MCERDPNIRTAFDVKEEFERLLKNKRGVKKKLNQDTKALTKNMLENLTLLANDRGMTQMLSCDDFNYN
jgi:hypothetical protein